jgi:hypothetical protein
LAVFVVGIFVGFRVLPSLFPVPAASAQQLEALEESTGILQRQIQHAVTALDNVESADAQLTLTLDEKSRRKGKAVIVPHFRSEPTAEQIDGLAILGDVTLIDGSGRHLNKKALVAQERKIFWTGIAKRWGRDVTRPKIRRVIVTAHRHTPAADQAALRVQSKQRSLPTLFPRQRLLQYRGDNFDRHVRQRWLMDKRLCIPLVLLSLFTPSTAEEATIDIVLIGDSTVTDDAGWGKAFAGRFLDTVTVHNLAVGGRSAKSWYDEKRLPAALALKPDFAFIQFGHNGQPGKGPERETDPATTYRDFLRLYVTALRETGTQPVLVS